MDCFVMPMIVLHEPRNLHGKTPTKKWLTFTEVLRNTHNGNPICLKIWCVKSHCVHSSLVITSASRDIESQLLRDTGGSAVRRRQPFVTHSRGQREVWAVRSRLCCVVFVRLRATFAVRQDGLGDGLDKLFFILIFHIHHLHQYSVYCVSSYVLSCSDQLVLS